MSVVSGVQVTLPTGERVMLYGLRARLVRAIVTDCNYLDADDYDLGRLEVNWAPSKRLDVRATRFHRGRE